MKRIVVILAAAAMASLTAPVQADVKTGVDAWQQGDYAKAIAEWRPLAEAGDPDAQFNLGQAYKLGRGVQSDMAMANNWYRKAAQQGHLRAEDSLGLLMFQQGDRAGAMPYLERAASRGEPRAQYIVGTSLFNGDVIGKDWVRAYALMSRASAAGLSQATTSLEQMGKYIPEDQRRQGTALAASLETGKSPKTEAAPIPVRSAAVSSPGQTIAAERGKQADSIEASDRLHVQGGPALFRQLARSVGRLQRGGPRSDAVEPTDEEGWRPFRLPALSGEDGGRDPPPGRATVERSRGGTVVRLDQGRGIGLHAQEDVTGAPSSRSTDRAGIWQSVLILQ